MVDFIRDYCNKYKIETDNIGSYDIVRLPEYLGYCCNIKIIDDYALSSNNIKPNGKIEYQFFFHNNDRENFYSFKDDSDERLMKWYKYEPKELMDILHQIANANEFKKKELERKVEWLILSFIKDKGLEKSEVLKKVVDEIIEQNKEHTLMDWNLNNCFYSKKTNNYYIITYKNRFFFKCIGKDVNNILEYMSISYYIYNSITAEKLPNIEDWKYSLNETFKDEIF